MASIDKGDLGVGSLKAFNLALLKKWRWRLVNKSDVLWACVIKAIHGVDARWMERVQNQRNVGENNGLVFSITCERYYPYIYVTSQGRMWICGTFLDRYARSRPNGKMIVDSIENGPYELTENDPKRMDADDQAMQTILLGLLEDVNAAVDSCETAKEIWEHVRQMMKENIASKSHDPLALMAHSQSSYNFPTTHKDQSSSGTHLKQSFLINNMYNPQPSLNQNYMQPPMTYLEDINDPTKAINDRQTQNVRGNGGNQFGQYVGQVAQNQQGYNAWQNGGIQGAQNAVQNAGVQSGDNQNRLVVVPCISNQSGTGNVVATRAEGTGIRNQARLSCSLLKRKKRGFNFKQKNLTSWLLQNGDQPLPRVTQVSIARTSSTEQPPLKDKSMLSDQEKRIQKIDRLARSLLIQGLPNDIYSLNDSNKTAKDLWDALARHMLGSEYSEQDRKAAVLYEYETFKATEGELLLDTYIRYLQVINDLKKSGYSKDNSELNFKDVNDAMGSKKKAVVVHSDPLALVTEKTNVNKRKENAFNQRKFYSKPTNNNLRTSSTSQSANKKQEFVKTDDKKDKKKADEKKRNMSRVKCYNYKKEGHFVKDCKKVKVKDYEYYKTKMLLAKKDKDEQVLLAEDQAWMESSSDSDQEINANMVFMAQIEKVLSDSEASSSSADEKISEVSYYLSESESESEFETSEYYDNSANYGSFVNNDDDQEIFYDAIESAKKYAKLEAERYEYMIRYSAYFDNDKQHRKHIADQEVLYDKMSVQLVELDKHIRDLKNTILEKDFKIYELEECVRNMDLEIEKCLERLNVCENKIHKIGQTIQTVHMIMPSKDNLYNGRKGIGFENPSYFKKAKGLRPTLYDEKVIGLGYTLMFLTHSDEDLEIEKCKRSRENKIEFAYDYGNLNASYVNEKINFEDDYFQEIINPDFEKIDSSFQQTSSLKPYVPNVILEKDHN
nr:hypothetical protein [Tanacetum cinerariifolium]